MELRHIRYFKAVAEEKNFTRAAEKLAIAQPPLSRQIQDLEEELGTKLFERSPHKVKLTEEGELFLQYASQILDLVNRSEEEESEKRAYREHFTLPQLRDVVLIFLHIGFQSFRRCIRMCSIFCGMEIQMM